MAKERLFSRWIITALLAALLTAGCGVNKSESMAPLPEEIKISDSCQWLTAQRAESVFQDIKDLRETFAEGIGKVENPTIVFSKESKKEDTITVEADFEADYTIIRKPDDNPIIQGMYEAKKNLKLKKEKEFAEKCIQGYLTEMNATYQVTERYPTTVIVKFNTKDKPEHYELFYDLVTEGKSNLAPFRQYAMENWKENVQERRQMGNEVLLENVEIDMENLTNQNETANR